MIVQSVGACLTVTQTPVLVDSNTPQLVRHHLDKPAVMLVMLFVVMLLLVMLVPVVMLLVVMIMGVSLADATHANGEGKHQGQHQLCQIRASQTGDAV